MKEAAPLFTGDRQSQVALYFIYFVLELAVLVISITLIGRLGQELSEFDNLVPVILGVVASGVGLIHASLGGYYAWINWYRARYVHTRLSL